jgi:hypothetical protein
MDIRDEGREVADQDRACEPGERVHSERLAAGLTSQIKIAQFLTGLLQLGFQLILGKFLGAYPDGARGIETIHVTVKMV